MIVEPDRSVPRTRQCFTSTGRSKATYSTKQQAKRAVRSSGMTPGAHAYRCGECGAFHIGNRPKAQP